MHVPGGLLGEGAGENLIELDEVGDASRPKVDRQNGQSTRGTAKADLQRVTPDLGPVNAESR